MTSTAAPCARFTYPAGGAGTVVIDLEGAAPEDHILRVIRTQRRFYESDLLDHLAGHGPRGGVYVDVGANIGNHSVFFGRFLADRVVAIEPDPHLVRLLVRNLRANGVARWTALPVAVGARPGTGRLSSREGYEGNAGAQRVVPAGAADGPTVPVDTLDRLLAGLGEPVADDVRLVKLDIEGMELEALEGARHLLEAQRPDIVAEAAGDVEHAGLHALLSGCGYREIARFCATPTYHFSHPGRAWPRGAAPSEEKR
ncbi:MAG TPA: FkbM family methyltransferase [Acidimicrobiales bacterium]|nr:FkbM family methyltransferase [Acidimicrobiales bacterium]